MKKLARLIAALACFSLSIPCVYADTITGSERVIIDANFFSAVGTLARGGSGVPPIGACNMGVFVDDGCGSAPAPLTASFARTSVFAPGGYMNTVAGTTANYMATNCGPSNNLLCRPLYNVAGSADDGYHIGFVTPLGNSSGGVACTPASVASGACMPTCTKSEATYDGTCLLDPNLIAVTGCTYTPGAGTVTSQNAPQSGGNLLFCATGFAGDLEHINLGPVNGHTCTALKVTSSATALTLNDFYYFNDAGNCATLQEQIFIQDVSATSMAMTNGEMDGNSSQFRDSLGSAACGAANQSCNAVDAISAGFEYPLSVQYVAIHDMPNRAFGTDDIIVHDSWVEGWTKSSGVNHAEWIGGPAQGQPAPNEIFDHFVVLGQKNQSQFGPAPLFYASNWGSVIVNFQFTNVVQVNGFIGGISAPSTTVSGTIGMPPSGGTATSPTAAAGTGAIFYQTSTTPNVIGQGNNLNNHCVNTTGGGTATAGNLGPFIPGPYAVTTPPIQGEWFIDNFSGAGVGGNIAFAAGSTAGGHGTFVLASAACSGTTVLAEPGDVAVIGENHGPTPATNVTIANNFIDASSQGGGTLWEMLGAQNPALVSISGTTMLVSNTFTATAGQFVYSPSIANCVSSVLGCPTITTTGAYPNGTPTGAPINGPAINVTNTSLVLYTPTSITSGTITGLNSLSTNGQTVTLAAGDTIYDVAGGTCSSALPASCPTVAVGGGGTGTTFPLTGATANTTAHAMTSLHQATSFSGTINNANPASLGAGNAVLKDADGAGVMVISGANANLGVFMGVPGCTSTSQNLSSFLATCPQSVGGNGGGTVFTLNISGGTVGGPNSFTSIEAIQAAWCLNPATFGGNVDMAHLLSDTFMNNWSFPPQSLQFGC